jgi:phage gp16-like protein
VIKPRTPRATDIMLIKIGVKQLGLDESTERDMYFALTGLRHVSEMDHSQRAKVVRHLQRRGAKIGRPAASRPAAGRDALLGKIAAQLNAAQLPEVYAEGIAKRMFGVERLAFCTPEMLRKIVAALAYRQAATARAAP